jgi:hypothetical protein
VEGWLQAAAVCCLVCRLRGLWLSCKVHSDAWAGTVGCSGCAVGAGWACHCPKHHCGVVSAVLGLATRHAASTCCRRREPHCGVVLVTLLGVAARQGAGNIQPLPRRSFSSGDGCCSSGCRVTGKQLRVIMHGSWSGCY